MEAARRAICGGNPFNPVSTTGMQAACVLVISHVFQIILKPFGQPGPIANILAGLVLGPSLLCRIDFFKLFFAESSTTDYYLLFSFISRVLFMFLIGLDTDVSYLRRNWRRAGTIAAGGLVVCSICGAISAYLILRLLHFNARKWRLAFFLPVLLANSSPPLAIRLADDLRITTSDVGRLGITSSVINEMSCVVTYYAYRSVIGSWKVFGKGVLCSIFTGVLVVVNKNLVSWFNKRNPHKKCASNKEILVVFCLLIAVAWVIEDYGFISTLSCFFVGLMFPREGKTTRTLQHKLTYSVNNFILPIFFGYIGFQFDVQYLLGFQNLIIIGLMVFLSFAGKIVGTLAACHYLKIPPNEGIIVAFILLLKGDTELLILDVIPKAIEWWNDRLHGLVLITVVLDTLISGFILACISRRKEHYFANKYTKLESYDPSEGELRMLACVYGSRHISATVGLVSALSGSQKAPSCPYLMHLVELPKKRRKTKLMYHQLKDGDQFSDEEEYGGNDALEINDAVDNFTEETKVPVQQSKVVSPFGNMYEDVCDIADESRVSFIITHLHKHQRIDEKLEKGKEGVRTSNQKVLSHAPCSVGILVDRWHSGFRNPSESVQEVATLFFGGPDDREALACSKRIAAHPHINLTVVRFLPSSPPPTEKQKTGWSNNHASSHRDDEVLLAISSDCKNENERDDALVDDFQNRYVKSGRAHYVEKYVNSGGQTAMALKELGDKYSLIIVGKGGQWQSSITADLSKQEEEEECPELGTVGDLMSSSEFHVKGSILIIQQHRPFYKRPH